MNAVVLCPGPSLSRLARPPAANFVLSINRAALAFRSDWWVALDWQTVRRDGPGVKGKPLLLTRRAHRPKYTRLPGLDMECVEHPSGGDVFGSTAALCLAAQLGVTHIDVYGNDRAVGEADFDGVTPDGSQRDERRWAAEAELWDRTVAWLVGRGVGVEREVFP